VKQIGVITVARWTAESLPDDMVAYMVSEGKLYHLKSVQSSNGLLKPLLEAPFRLHASSEWGAVPESYSLESPVFLTTRTDLTGVALESVAESVEECQVGCWALRDKPVCAVIGGKESEAQEAWESPWKCATSIPVESWYG
jgi:hypothetical protein